MIDSVEKFYFNNEFVSYKMTLINGKVWTVPLAEDNTDYQAIQEWVAEGNTIEEAA